jgi:hypothetical protein
MAALHERLQGFLVALAAAPQQLIFGVSNAAEVAR